MNRRLFDFVAVVIVSAAVSWGITEWRSNSATPGTDVSSVAPITLADRQTVQMSEKMIAPALSGQALVVPAEEDGRFMLQAGITPVELAYQLIHDPIGVKASITGGPAGFDCEWAGLGVGIDGRAVMQCIIPADVVVVQGLGGMMGVQLEAPTTTMALPVTAVRGTIDRGEVVVVHDDGTTEVRAVDLGTQDAFSVQIVSGLDPDESVLLAPFGSDFRNTAP